jgi:YbbR domain-containing protein
VIAFFRQLIFHDFWLKLFSLALAVLIWVTVSFAIRQQGSPVSTLGLPVKERSFFGLPVVVLSSAEDVRTFKVSPSEVEVTVQGEAKILDKLQGREIRVIVDLTGVTSRGDFFKRIEVATPPGVTHVRVVPPEVQVLFPLKN